MTAFLMAPNFAEKPLVLASGSRTRAHMLSRAGLAVEIEKPNVDEAPSRRSMIAEGASVEAGAARLAELKARDVSRNRPGTLVIGADQILECDGYWFEKPDTMQQAREQLLRLSGRRHRLISSVVVAIDGDRVWHHADQALLTMRPLGQPFMTHYLREIGEAALTSVGGYQLEGLGAQLFSRIDGDYFTILGLPLLPLLAYLRSRDVLGS
jgi:septum formation protein